MKIKPMTREEMEKIVSEARAKGEFPNLSGAKITEAQILTFLKYLNIKIRGPCHNIIHIIQRGWHSNIPFCCILYCCFYFGILDQRDLAVRWNGKGYGLGYAPCYFHKLMYENLFRSIHWCDESCKNYCIDNKCEERSCT